MTTTNISAAQEGNQTSVFTDYSVASQTTFPVINDVEFLSISIVPSLLTPVED